MLKIIGMRKEKYVTYNGQDYAEKYPQESEKHFIYCINELGSKKKISLEVLNGECGSGYCSATRGQMIVEYIDEFESFNFIPKNELKIEDIEVGYGYYGDYNCNVFNVSFDGGDEYYPCGWYDVNEDLFKKDIRYKENRPVWLFKGDSNSGKSFLSHRVSDKTVYETDSNSKLPEIMTSDIIVLGNKYNFSIKDIKNRLFGDIELIIVDFSEYK